MPVQGPIHVDKPLSNISIGYKSEGLIADQLFPAVPVQHESDVYFVWDKANALRTPKSLRANGAEANEDNLVLSTASYRLQEYALKDIITKRDRDNADPAVNLEVSTVEDLTDKILRQREIDAASLVFTNGNWANESSLATAGQWGLNTTASNPILVALSAGSAILTNCGRMANTCVLDSRTWDAVREHTSVVDRIKYTSAQSVGEDMVKNLFGVERLLIARGVQNSASEGLAATMANIWGDNAWFGYVARNPGLKNPSALYCMKKSGGGTQVKRYPDEPRNGEWFEVSHMYDQIAPATDAGYLVVDTIA